MPETPGPPQISPRFPLIDSLRGLAAASVFLYHFAAVRPHMNGTLEKLFGHGNDGVVLFFLISGFLLYRPFVAARAEPHRRIALRGFYMRRILRIVPAYWVALCLLAIYPGVPDFHTRWWQLFLFGQIYDPKTTFAGIGPAWSLCIEVSFYALLPLYAVVVSRALRNRSRRAALWIELAALAGLAVISAAAHQWIHGQGSSANLSYTLPATFYLFAVGMGLAVLHVHADGRVLARVARWAPVCWGLAVVLYVGLALSVSAQTLGSVHPLYGLVALLILAPAVSVREGALVRALASRPLIWAGLVSYAFYLWHQPVLDVLGRHVSSGPELLVAAAVLTGVIATLSFVAVERPWLRLAHRGVRAPLPASGAGLVEPVRQG
jgi:peptidoglycan/LPS O-acetylase OafA/YrhL